MPLRLAAALMVLALLASSALSRANAQATPDSVRRGPKVTLEYDTVTDSTTRSLSAFAFVDTTVTPPDSIAVELLQRWKGRGTTAPVASVELGLGRTHAAGVHAARFLK